MPGNVRHHEGVTRVGVVEDDASVRRVLSDALRMNGHEVVIARNGQEALRNLTPSSGVDVLVIDIGLPDADGRDVCQALRTEGQHAPVLFLTALDAVHDRVSGFNAGGDDYVPKPFALSEVMVRIEALHRRTRPAPTEVTGLHLDPDRYAVRHGDLEQRLTPTEFRMLAAIAAQPGDRRTPPRCRGRRVARRRHGQREHHRLLHPPAAASSSRRSTHRSRSRRSAASGSSCDEARRPSAPDPDRRHHCTWSRRSRWRRWSAPSYSP